MREVQPPKSETKATRKVDMKRIFIKGERTER